MPDDFDPYHRWLGIPPQDQPPHLYRLLGIAPFESDREVIDSVASRHIAFLQEITDGPYVRHAQRLLNELSAARRKLLDPVKKAAYDRMLRAELQPPTAADADTEESHCKTVSLRSPDEDSVALPVPPPAPPQTAQPPIVTARRDPPRARSKRSPANTSDRRWRWEYVLGGGVCLTALACLLLFLPKKSANENRVAASRPVATAGLGGSNSAAAPSPVHPTTVAPPKASPLAKSPPVSPSSESTLRFNFGAQDSLTDENGATWLPAEKYSDGKPGFLGGRRTKGGQPPGTVHETAVVGIEAVRIPLTSGQYRVTLHFCENWVKSAARRRFAVHVESAVVIPDFAKLLTEHGLGQPIAFDVPAVEVDSLLEIDFEKLGPAGASTTILNGLEVTPIQ